MAAPYYFEDYFLLMDLLCYTFFEPDVCVVSARNKRCVLVNRAIDCAYDYFHLEGRNN